MSVQRRSTQSGRMKYDPEKVLVPFKFGWMRILVHRKTGDTSDVYYSSPDSKVLRSTKEIEKYLATTCSNANLLPENFTFVKKFIYQPPHEIARNARVMKTDVTHKKSLDTDDKPTSSVSEFQSKSQGHAGHNPKRALAVPSKRLDKGEAKIKNVDAKKGEYLQKFKSELQDHAKNNPTRSLAVPLKQLAVPRKQLAVPPNQLAVPRKQRAAPLKQLADPPKRFLGPRKQLADPPKPPAVPRKPTKKGKAKIKSTNTNKGLDPEQKLRKQKGLPYYVQEPGMARIKYTALKGSAKVKQEAAVKIEQLLDSPPETSGKAKVKHTAKRKIADSSNPQQPLESPSKRLKREIDFCKTEKIEPKNEPTFKDSKVKRGKEKIALIIKAENDVKVGKKVLGSTVIQTAKTRKGADYDHEKVKLPLAQGWKRVIVKRRSLKMCDVYYYAPDKTKLRSMCELRKYLLKHSGLKPENFTFVKREVSCSSNEIARCAGDIVELFPSPKEEEKVFDGKNKQAPKPKRAQKKLQQL